MEPTNDDASTLKVRDAKASLVIVHRLEAAKVETFLEWQRSIVHAMGAVPGYRATEVFPPAEAGGREWTVVLHFADNDSLQGWLNSPLRAEWMAKLPKESSEFQIRTIAGGF